MSATSVSVQRPAGQEDPLESDSEEKIYEKRAPRQRFGRVISVSDTQLLILIEAPESGFTPSNRPRIGMHVCIESDGTDIVATISALSAPNIGNVDDWADVMIAEVELVGELAFAERQSDAAQRRVFRRGIGKYPALGQIAAFMSKGDLQCVYGVGGENQVNIGRICHHEDFPATFNWNKLCVGSFGIFGAPGSGKSCALVKILRGLVISRHPASIALLDINDEYSRSFGKASEKITIGPGVLPYWMLNKAELASILECGTRPLDQNELAILEEAIPFVRRSFRQQDAGQQEAKMRVKPSNNNLDTPYPYSLTHLINYIDQVASSTKTSADAAKQLGARLRFVSNNREFECFFGGQGQEISSDLSVLIGELFRLPKRKKPISIIKLAHLSGVALDAAVSVITRLAFAAGKWGNGKAPIVLCIEESHRFLHVNSDRKPVAAKAVFDCVEMGQRYGVGIGLLSSRLRLMDRASLDHLSTLIAMRLPNQADQALIHEIAPEAAYGMLSSVGTLNAAEAIVLGHGVTLPMRLKFDVLAHEALPGGGKTQMGMYGDINRREVEQAFGGGQAHFVDEIVNNWRGISNK